MEGLAMTLDQKLRRLSPDERKGVKEVIVRVMGFSDARSSYPLFKKQIGDLQVDVVQAIASQLGMGLDAFMDAAEVIPVVKVPMIEGDLADLRKLEDAAIDVKQWLTSLQWDGEDHIGAMCDVLELVDDLEHDHRATIKNWLVNAVLKIVSKEDRHFNPMLVLEGPQGCGKTTWIHHLLSTDSGIKDLRPGAWPIKPKDLAKKGIVHLDDLAGIMRHPRSLDELKTLITLTEVRFRNKGMPFVQAYKTITSFIGATNDAIDMEAVGNRRFLVIPIKGVDVEALRGIDASQVWAQACACVINREAVAGAAEGE